MSKYTKEQVISERRCGLKKFDEAVSKLGLDTILKRTVEIHNDFPDVWGEGFGNLEWSFANAWRGAFKKDVSATFNLDEALSDNDLNKLITDFNLDRNDYLPSRKRKVSLEE